MTQAPTLTTERLTLRHHVAADFDPMAAHFATDWAKYMGGPISRDAMWHWLAAEIVSWNWLGFGSWAIELRKTGEFIGQVGINKPPRFPEVELGWCLFPGQQRKGYGREAARAARNWGFDVAGLQTLVSYIDPENTASIALAESLGTTRDLNAAVPDEGDFVYRHPAKGDL